MQNSIVMSTFFACDRKHLFWEKWNLVPRIIQMQNSMVMFTFFVFGRNYPFWANLIPKFKIVCVHWKLILRLIRICGMLWWCSFFPFSTGNTLLGQIWFKKIRILFLSSNLVPRPIWVCRIQLWYSLFQFLTAYIYFGQI